MNRNWFTDEKHLVYINAERGLKQLEKDLRYPGLEAAAEAFLAAPTAQGVQIRGPKRTTARLFIPNLYFDEAIEMGENLFFYQGEMKECYVLFRPRK